MSHQPFTFRPGAEPRLLEAEVARRTVKLGSLFCGVSALGFAGLYAWQGPPEFVLPHVFAAAILAVLAQIATRKAGLALYLGITLGLLLFGYQLLLLGRIDNGVVVWFLVPFSGAMMLGFHRLAIYCAFLAAFEILGVIAAARMGWLSPRAIMAEPDLVMGVSVLAVMTLVGLFAFVAQRARRLLIHELEMRNTNLAAVNKELESFAYSISHDLRAPLRGIDGFTYLLYTEYGEKLDAQGKAYLDRARAAAQRMGALIDDILELSRISRHNMQRSKVDLSQIARDVIEELKHSAPQRQVETRIEDACFAFGDPQLLRLMLQNLLENAWKYTGREVAPKIEFGRERGEDGEVFFVRDNGVGFDMAYADRLFSPFQRLHKPEEFAGSGIGLATVARIVHNHGGDVWAESAPGQGTTLRFTLAESEM
ncbi:two-component system, OmpR family, phosphate regulon sensor histidine kinase PhoR [Burkholderiales bacterium]|nr:MAG: hypothetical protein F9K47_04190 [Burkholderiales bacterium]CAG1012570.1 two-component system, OmpR family, phosphate regulon sensor histidine kinase PhoR [Burkholderiales bacterium]